MTEICNDNEHYFILEIGTERGAMVVEGLDLQDADCGQIEAAAAVSKNASKQQRSLNTYNLKQRIYDNIENKAYFADVADRCLNCANCTMVCPTCFCSTVEDVTDLAGESAQRVRYWDSCFNASHSYIVGGSVRQSGDSRYRQWLMHKLAIAGAQAKYLSVSLILEEGLDMQVLHRILVSMRRAADETGVRNVTGVTKVVDRGKGDGLYINTTGLGFVNEQVKIHPQQIKPGDRILVSGDLGRHGIAVMAKREGLQFDSQIESDCAPLNKIVQELIESGIDIHCLRDITRGGLVSILNEMDDAAAVGFELEEQVIPFNTEVRAACELLGGWIHFMWHARGDLLLLLKKSRLIKPLN